MSLKYKIQPVSRNFKDAEEIRTYLKFRPYFKLYLFHNYNYSLKI